MGRKKQRPTWPEAKKLCRLNQLDIEMAKRLGFGPDALIHAVPSPQQRWKLPVKDWIHELHFSDSATCWEKDRWTARRRRPLSRPLSRWTTNTIWNGGQVNLFRT
jgi:hypothetical protein